MEPVRYCMSLIWGGGNIFTDQYRKGSLWWVIINHWLIPWSSCAHHFEKMWEFWLSSCSSLCTVVIACSWNYFPIHSQISNKIIFLSPGSFFRSSGTVPAAGDITFEFTFSYLHNPTKYLVTNINKIHSIHIWHIAKTFSFDDSQNNTFEEVYLFGKWVKGVSGMEVKWKWGDNVLKVRHSEVKVETQWGESRIWMFCKNVTWSSPTLAILSRPSPPPLSHALQGFIIAFH